MLKRTTLKMQAYDYLKKAILNDEFKLDIIYSEQYFADLLNISRTPVREAILQLSQEGFVDILPNRGISIRQISELEILQMFQLRTAIEGYCCKFAAENIKTEKGLTLLQDLEALLKEEEKIFLAHGKPLEYMSQDTNFHLSIVRFTENPQLIGIMNNLRSRINQIGIKTLYKQGRMEATLQEHQAILFFMKNGNGAKAYEAAQNHFNKALACILAGCTLKV
ncbi:MAG: GntR family transcriptional regulator [Peptococcaceae bacterium]